MDVSNLKYYPVMNIDNKIIGKRKVYSVRHVVTHRDMEDLYLINNKILRCKEDVEKCILLNDRVDLPILEDVINNNVEINKFEYYPVFDYNTKDAIGKRKVRHVILVENPHCYLINDAIIMSIPSMERDYSHLPVIE